MLNSSNSIPYDADLRTIAKKMLMQKSSSLEVMKDGTVVGVVSYEHLLRALINLLDHSEKLSLPESVQKIFYSTPVGEIINTLAQAGI